MVQIGIPETCCSGQTRTRSVIIWGLAACRSAQRVPRRRAVHSVAYARCVSPVLLVLAACIPSSSRAPADPEFKLRALRAAVVEYRARVGDLPSTLEQTCMLDSTLCRMEPSERWLRDAWGTTVRFDVGAGTYRLASAGPDRSFGTNDDLVLDAMRDSLMASRLAGCYELAANVPRLGGSRLEFTMRLVRSGGYEIRSPLLVRGDTASIAEWYPVGGDSLAARWILIDRGVSLRAQVSDDRISGRTSGRQVTGHTVTCD